MATQTEIETQFTVTRQSRWQDGKQIVEISAGDGDYTNPDALCKQYPGEFETFIGLTPALEAAIKIADQWKKDTGKTGREIRIAVGATLGMTMHFDDLPANIKSYRLLRKQATELDEKMPKCDRCGDIMGPPKERWKNQSSEWSGEEFCSQNCAERAQEFDDEQDALEDEEE